MPSFDEIYDEVTRERIPSAVIPQEKESLDSAIPRTVSSFDKMYGEVISERIPTAKPELFRISAPEFAIAEPEKTIVSTEKKAPQKSFLEEVSESALESFVRSGTAQLGKKFIQSFSPILGKIVFPENLDEEEKKDFDNLNKETENFAGKVIGTIAGSAPDFIGAGKFLTALGIIPKAMKITQATAISALAGLAEKPETASENIIGELEKRGINAAKYGLTAAGIGVFIKSSVVALRKAGIMRKIPQVQKPPEVKFKEGDFPIPKIAVVEAELPVSIPKATEELIVPAKGIVEIAKGLVTPEKGLIVPAKGFIVPPPKFKIELIKRWNDIEQSGNYKNSIVPELSRPETILKDVPKLSDLPTAGKLIEENPELKMFITDKEISVFHRIFAPIYSQIQRLGGKQGKEIRMMIQDANLTASIEKAKHTDNLSIIAKNIPKDKSRFEVIEKSIKSGDDTELTDKELEVARAFRRIMNNVADRTKELGIKVKDRSGKESLFVGRQGHFPLMYDRRKINTPEFRDSAFAYLKENKDSLIKKLGLDPKKTTIDDLYDEWANNRFDIEFPLESANKLIDYTAKNLQYHRVFEMPGNIKNPSEALEKYLSSVTKKFAEVQTFGNDLEKLKGLLNEAGKTTSGNDMVKLNRLINDAREVAYQKTDREGAVEDVFEYMRALGTPLLTASAPVNISGGFYTTALRGGFLNTAKNALAATKFIRAMPMIRGISKENLQFLKETGKVTKDIGSRFIESSFKRELPKKWSDAWLTLSQMKSSEFFVRNLSVNVGKDFFLKTLKAYPQKSKTTLSNLERFNVTPERAETLSKELIKLGKEEFKEKYRNDILKAASQFSNNTQGDLAVGSKPAWMNTPSGRGIMQFRRIAVDIADEHSYIIGQAIKNRDTQSLAALLRISTAPVFGYVGFTGRELIKKAIGDLASLVGIPKETKELEDIFGLPEDEKEALAKIIAWITTVAALNIFLDGAISSVERPGSQAARFVLGPPERILSGTEATIERAVKGEFAPAAVEAVTTAIPALRLLLPKPDEVQ